jgi:hypothetical protein
LDPYGVYPNLPGECQQIGRVEFARSSESDIWVCFYDLLTDETREQLWKMHETAPSPPLELSDRFAVDINPMLDPLIAGLL